MSHRLAGFLSLIALTVCGCASQVKTHGIPNLSLVEPGVWRGGQPNSEGWAWLASQGVKYDVKLNTWDEGSDLEAFEYGIFVQRDGMINLRQQTIGKPDSYVLACAVQSIANHSGVIGVFVHCEHGQDRTGLVVGAYRVTKEGWSKEAAYQEMLEHGFHPILRGLARAWNEVDQSEY